MPAVQQVHGIDDQGNVAGVLAGRATVQVHGLQRMLVRGTLPAANGG
jgi:hypothetical protein